MSKALNGPEVQALLEVIATGGDHWGRAFADLRRLAELSQKDVARAVGCNPATISKWEHSDNRPHSKTLRKALNLMVDPQCLRAVMPSTAQEAAEMAEAQAHSETLAGTLTALDALTASSEDDAEKALYKLQREMLAVQIGKALKGDTRAASFVSTWSQRFIEEHRRASQRRPEPTPENAVFVRRARSELLPATDEPHVKDDVPKVSRASHTPGPIEERPTQGYEGPRRDAEQFINASNSDEETYTVRRNGAVYKTSGRFSPPRPEF
jgi:transcriptional regulator with XRE-family HTH domain